MTAPTRRQGRPPGARNKDDAVARRLTILCEQHIEQQVDAIGMVIIPKLVTQMIVIMSAFGIEPTHENQAELVKAVAQVYTKATPADRSKIPHLIAQRLAHAWHTQLALNYIDKALAELGGAKEERHEHDDNDVG
jgi:hypothetical protein